MKTTKENLKFRLYARFAFLLFLSILISTLLFLRTPVTPFGSVGLFAFLPISLALLAPLLSVPNTYLSTLALLYGGYNGILLARSISLVRVGTIGFLPFNGALLLVLFALVLFLLSTTKACQFAFENQTRDAALLCKPPFLKYLAEAVLFTALALSVYYLWSKLLTNLPL